MINDTGKPAQIVVFPTMEIAGVTGRETIVVIPFDVAGLFVTPGISDVKTQVTICPLVNVGVV